MTFGQRIVSVFAKCYNLIKRYIPFFKTIKSFASIAAKVESAPITAVAATIASKGFIISSVATTVVEIAYYTHKCLVKKEIGNK
jgi:hypothetical protein